MEPTYRAKPPHFVPSNRTGAKKNEVTWRVEVVDSDGKFHKSKSFKTKAAANQWGPEYLADMRRGIDSGMTDIRDAQLTVAGLIAKYNDDDGSGSDQRNLIISLRKATQARPKTRLNRLSARKIVTS